MAKRGRPPSKPVDPMPSVDGGNENDVVASTDSASSGDTNSIVARPDQSGAIDPTSVKLNNDGSDDGQPRKRGWPKGRPRGARAATQSPPADLSGIEKMLYGLHMIGASLVAPEFGMDKDDCRELAKAIADVNRHYQIKLLDQKTADWFHLIQLVAVAYGTRIIAISGRRRRENKAPPMPRPQNGPIAGTPAAPVAPRNLDLTETQLNGVSAREIRTGEIPGVGKIEFPSDHPFASRRN